MPKSFNMDGPCNPAEHCMIPASRRLGDEMLDLVERKKYFLLRAPRQTGKTTLLKDLARRVASQGNCHAIYCSLESLRTVSDPEKGIRRTIQTIRDYAVGAKLPNTRLLDSNSEYGSVLYRTLSAYCESLDKPLVIFFDEVDALSGDLLLEVLGQLGEGYNNRDTTPFIHSLALAGMRDLGDLRYDPNDSESKVGDMSPFNVVSTLVLRDFTAGEVKELYGQYTEETGQAFTREAIDRAYSLTLGQPWLVNAIGDLSAKATPPGSQIGEDTVNAVARSLMLSREMHFKSLGNRLKEERVRKVLKPLVVGDMIHDKYGDEYNYVRDLGLIRNDGDGTRFANPIYAEVILRTLALDSE